MVGFKVYKLKSKNMKNSGRPEFFHTIFDLIVRFSRNEQETLNDFKLKYFFIESKITKTKLFLISEQ